MGKNNNFEVRPEQRQSWQSIAAIWAGGMICVPCLMIGGVLSGGGLSIVEIIASILIGYGLICAYMIFIGMQACDTGLPVSVMASGSPRRKRGPIHHQHHTDHCLRWVVWRPICHLWFRVCFDAGNDDEDRGHRCNEGRLFHLSGVS